MASRKTKRVAAVTILTAFLMIGGAAVADPGNENQCKDHPGRGEMSGEPGKGKGQGVFNGRKKCRQQDGGNTQPPAGDTGGGGSTVDAGSDSNQAVEVTVDVDVILPGVSVPNALPLAEDVATGAETVAGVALDAAGHMRGLAEDDVSSAVEIVKSAVEDAMGLADGTGAGAGVTMSGGTVVGSFNVGTEAVEGATALGTGLLDSTLGLADGTADGSAAILGSAVLSIF